MRVRTDTIRVNLDDRNPCRDYRNDGRIVGSLRDSGGDGGRFHQRGGTGKGNGLR